MSNNYKQLDTQKKQLKDNVKKEQNINKKKNKKSPENKFQKETMSILNSILKTNKNSNILTQIEKELRNIVNKGKKKKTIIKNDKSEQNLLIQQKLRNFLGTQKKNVIKPKKITIKENKVSTLLNINVKPKEKKDDKKNKILKIIENPEDKIRKILVEENIIESNIITSEDLSASEKYEEENNEEEEMKDNREMKEKRKIKILDIPAKMPISNDGKRKVISFCIWGNCNLYNYGIWENAMLIPVIYPGWIMRVYYTESCKQEIIKELKKLPYVECSLFVTDNSFRNTMLRFLPAYEENNDVVIVRDADSRVNKREKAAVDQWLKSDKDFHIMRDHPKNRTKILAGLWGARKKILVGKLDDFFEWFDNPPNRRFSSDQQFLARKIYPLVKNNTMIHASFNKYEPWALSFPENAPGRSKGFVGKTYFSCPIAEKHFNLKIIRLAKKRCI